MARELILLLHGFAESGERLFRKLEPVLTEEILEHALILAPNAPFPMPHKKDSGYSVTFSWYFYEPGAAEYYIDMQAAIAFVCEGLRAHGAWDLPKRIIGFSQGGFLAPILATRLPAMKQLIGVGCEYLVDEIPGSLPQSVPYRVDAVHGSDDESVDPTAALNSHRRLLDSGVRGHFDRVEGASHKIDDLIRHSIRNALIRA